MTANHTRDSLTKFLSSLSKAEQLQVMMTHPFFTGYCPQCGQEFAQITPPPEHWDCQACGWLDKPSSPDASLAKELTPAEPVSKRLGTYLIEADLITQDQIDLALVEQTATKMRLGEILVKQGWIQEQALEDLIERVVKPQQDLLVNASH